MRLTHLERPKEVSCATHRGADRVDDPQTGGGGPDDLEPSQVLRGDRAGVAWPKMESTQAEPRPIDDERHEGAHRRGRQRHSDRFQDGREDRMSFVKVAGSQELHGGPPPELQ